MARSKDLDIIAPDDPVVSAPTSPKPKKIKKAKADYSQKIYDIFGHTKHSLSSILVRPHVFNFSEKNDDEEVLLVARQHWIVNVSWIVIAIAMAIFPMFFSIVPLLSSFPANFQFIAIIFWYLITFAFAFEKFISWYFNVYIITGERIIDVDFNNLLVKRYSSADLDMIQDTTSEIIGAIPTVFNYGKVLVQTASEVNEIEFENVPNPEKIIKLLQDLHENYGGEH